MHDDHPVDDAGHPVHDHVTAHGVDRPLGEPRIPVTTGIHARATRFARRGDTHMDESTRNDVIVDAKRRARAHSKATGESHQRSLDHIARLRGRQDWADFLTDPAGPQEDRSLAWILAIGDRLRSRPGPILTGALVFTLFSLAVINLEGASRNGLLPIHVPMWLWLPCMIAWGVIVAIVFAGMIAISVNTLKRMARGTVDTGRVVILMYTMLLVVWILIVWAALEGAVVGTASHVAFFTVASMIVVLLFVEGRAHRRTRERLASAAPGRKDRQSSDELRE